MFVKAYIWKAWQWDTKILDADNRGLFLHKDENLLFDYAKIFLFPFSPLTDHWRTMNLIVVNKF